MQSRYLDWKSGDPKQGQLFIANRVDGCLWFSIERGQSNLHYCLYLHDSDCVTNKHFIADSCFCDAIFAKAEILAEAFYKDKDFYRRAVKESDNEERKEP